MKAIFMPIRVVLILLITAFFFSFAPQDGRVIKHAGRSIPIFDYDELEEYLADQQAETLVVNFWATWCMPCVQELPAFEQLNKERKDLKVILVSIDFDSRVKSHVIPFLNKEKIKSEVVVMDDPDQNKWIDAISGDWSGSIPATLVIKKDRRVFHEGKMNYEELIHLLNQ